MHTPKKIFFFFFKGPCIYSSHTHLLNLNMPCTEAKPLGTLELLKIFHCHPICQMWRKAAKRGAFPRLWSRGRLSGKNPCRPKSSKLAQNPHPITSSVTANHWREYPGSENEAIQPGEAPHSRIFQPASHAPSRPPFLTTTPSEPTLKNSPKTQKTSEHTLPQYHPGEPTL